MHLSLDFQYYINLASKEIIVFFICKIIWVCLHLFLCCQIFIYKEVKYGDVTIRRAKDRRNVEPERERGRES